MISNRPSPEAVLECMQLPENIRNVCILAHVDHGKTTIADSLLATNRLVSKRMAGFVRYLDDRLDEQERGITMKSSAVSLLNVFQSAEGQEVKLLLNLIDTPGHIDFSSEVSAALRVCDGALIVVDLVEGVCVQTREAIKQAFTEKCKMVLILNKFDKLIVELNKDINEIFQVVLHAIEDCNAIIAELYQYEGTLEVDIEDTGLLFSPEANNVIFASAVDGWGFTLRQIAGMFVDVIKDETVDSLMAKLWNFDAYVDSKSGTIKLGAVEKNKSNVFVQLCLKTIVHVYTTIVLQMQRDKVKSIAEKLKVTDIVLRDMNHNDPKVQLRAVMQAWSPLAKVILMRCLDVIPAPNKMEEDRVKYLLDSQQYCENEYVTGCLEKLVSNFTEKVTDGNCIAYVSKMFCVNSKNLSQNKPKIFVPKPKTEALETTDTKEVTKDETEESKKKEEERDFEIVALARVFTGTLSVGQEIYVLSPKYIPSEDGDGKGAQLVTVKELYILFGRDLVLVDSVKAGNVCGIGGLEAAIVRTASLSTTLECVPFIENASTPPVVRNAIEPQNPKDLPVLRRGLRTLMQSDSCVQVMLQETGEHVLLTAGDVHLAKCLEDLTSKFAKIEINVSSPMVSLRETVVVAGKGELRKAMENPVTKEISSQILVSIIVVSLPDEIIAFVEKNYKGLRGIEEHQNISGFEISAKCGENLKPSSAKRFKSEAMSVTYKHLKELLKNTFANCDKFWSQLRVWSVGNMSDSINLLLNATTDYQRSIFETLDETDNRSHFDHLIVNAFNSCCKSGPLCEEPLKNCAFLVKNFKRLQGGDTLDGSTRANINVESSLASAFREAFEQQPQRLMEPVFTTTIQVNTSILGKVYTVVSKRHGKVLDAVGMDEQEKSFMVKAQIPVVESTGFANEVRKTTSGQAIPNLKFSHFEVIDGDPFYEPLEDEDEEEDGVNVESAVRATKLRKDIRKRKGLYVDEQVVIHAEKQRTLNKKK